MTVSGEDLADRPGQVLVVGQHELRLGCPHPECARRLRQQLTQPVGKLADVSAAPGREADGLSGDRIACSQAEFEHVTDKHRLVLPLAEQATEVRAVMPGGSRASPAPARIGLASARWCGARRTISVWRVLEHVLGDLPVAADALEDEQLTGPPPGHPPDSHTTRGRRACRPSRTT